MNLQDLRKKANISQPELSKLSGVREKTIKDYEQGYRKINQASGEKLFRIASALGCSMEDLLEDTQFIKDYITSQIVNEAVETEMNEGCHLDYIEDYESPLEFFLSNAKADSYISYLESRFHISKEKANHLQVIIIKEIENRSIG